MGTSTTQVPAPRKRGRHVDSTSYSGLSRSRSLPEQRAPERARRVPDPAPHTSPPSRTQAGAEDGINTHPPALVGKEQQPHITTEGTAKCLANPTLRITS